MKKHALYVAILVLAVGPTAFAALAEEDRATTNDLTEQAISQIVTYAGYDVVDIDLDGDIYHVQAYRPEGEKVRLQVLADDGSILAPAERQNAGVVARD